MNNVITKQNVLKMNDEQTLNFVSSYGKEEVLWNTKLESYRNKDARSKSVKRIVTAMNIEGFGPEHVIIKFNNLRSSYCQELKKIAASEKSGALVEDIYVPHVVWFNKMNSFLKPFVTIRNTCSNFMSPNENKSNCVKKIVNAAMIETNVSTELQTSNIKAELNLKSDPSTSYSNTKTTKRKKFQSSQKRDWNLKKRKLEHSKLSSSDSDTMLAAVKQLDSIADRAEKLSQYSKKEDSFYQFGKYIASVLRDLPLKKACLLQQKITNMVMNEIMEND